jgi:hypothetical protein
LKANRRILTSSIDEEKEEENLKQKELREIEKSSPISFNCGAHPRVIRTN